MALYSLIDRPEDLALWRARVSPKAVASSGRKREKHILGRELLRALLSHAGAGTGWRFETAGSGALHVCSVNGKAENIFVSLSYSQNAVACALSFHGKIGIDVERYRSRDFLTIARLYFGPNEYKHVAENGAPAFYRIWTLREALAKLSELGLPEAADGKDKIELADMRGGWQQGEVWLTTEIILPGLALSMAIAKGKKEQKIERISSRILLREPSGA